jgi:hypothetical protein
MLRAHRPLDKHPILKTNSSAPRFVSITWGPETLMHNCSDYGPRMRILYFAYYEPVRIVSPLAASIK